MKLRFLISLILIPASLIINAQDYNGLGFEAYKKGEFEKAIDLFRKSTEDFPENHFGWYNLARTTFILNKEAEADDPCDVKTNWEFEVLSYLTKSYAINSESVLTLLARNEPNFDDFKAKISFKKWLSAARYPTLTGEQIKSWFVGAENKISVTSDIGNQTYEIDLAPVTVDSEGKNKSHTLYLRPESDSKAFQELILGPRFGDCGFYNF